MKFINTNFHMQKCKGFSRKLTNNYKLHFSSKHTSRCYLSSFWAVKSNQQNKELQSVQQRCLLLSCMRIYQTNLFDSITTSETLNARCCTTWPFPSGKYRSRWLIELTAEHAAWADPWRLLWVLPRSMTPAQWEGLCQHPKLPSICRMHKRNFSTQTWS